MEPQDSELGHSMIVARGRLGHPVVSFVFPRGPRDAMQFKTRGAMPTRLNVCIFSTED